MRKSIILILLLLTSFLTVCAQQNTDTLTWNQFKEIIKKYHPVAMQANLVESLAKARMKQAWGNFDPKLSANFEQKVYDGTEYYQFLTPEIKLPLWYGLELKGNYSEAEGVYINPESRLPAEGLSFIGLNMSLGKGLLIDKRRAAVKQANIFKEASANQQLLIINDLILDAGEAYLYWQNSYQITLIYEQALKLTEVRYEAVKNSVIGGDRPAIDTVEAVTQIQQRQIQLQQAQLNLKSALYDLGSFMWLPQNQPVDIEKLNILPQKQEIEIPQTLNPAITNNPKLLSYGFKLRDLEVEKRLKAESLRPTLDLQVGLLNTGQSAFRNINRNYWENNNKIGLQFSFPLTFTTARGDLAEAKLKIKDTEYEQSLVRNNLEVKFNQNRAEATTLKAQLVIIKQSVEANKKLVEGEEMRFKFGDSSLFLINARESKLIETQEKLIETENKIRKNKLKAEWILGALTN
ncbi:TolC family protein [Pedobacter cryophilus]|uniref:TolC family protein n=1 Tax=Pedobacter cryophilus TaxID=2571271 RepID=A0A4U1BYP8_9SPHI|nr:TolC family protein [Pedobacter cryophilus]TKB97875.1 TolC family protein [Pedobacter cryophilus]